MSTVSYTSLINVISNILRLEYNNKDFIISSIIDLIEKNENEIKQYEPKYDKMVERIVEIIKNETETLDLVKYEIEFILKIIDYESITNKTEENKSSVDKNDLDIFDIPYNLRDFEYVATSLKLLSFARPIVITELFGCLYTQNESNYNDTNVLKKIFNDSITQIMNQFNNKSFVNNKNIDNYNIDDNLWKYSDIEISLLWDIYNIYKYYNSYLINRNINFSTSQFRLNCIDIDNNILTEETTIFQNAIDYFDKNIIKSLNILNKNTFIINDDIRIYIHFLFGFNKYLNYLSLNLNKNMCPLQFDIMFIPKNMKNIMNDTDITYKFDFKSSDFKDSKYIESLIGNDDTYISLNSINKIFEKYKEMIDELHSKTKDYGMKESRYIFIINRCNKIKQRIYLYRYKNNIVENDGFMHFRTKRNILNKFKDENKFKYLFILSFHLHSYNKHRLYWHFNNQCIRFFPNMINKLWTKYFIINHNDKQIVNYLNSLKIKNGFSFKFEDFEFDKYYRLITGCFNLNNLNYKRNIKQLIPINNNKYSLSTNIINTIQTSLKDLNQDQFNKIFLSVINKICNLNSKTKQKKQIVDISKCKEIVEQLHLNGRQFIKINQNLLKKSLMNANINKVNAQKIIDYMFKMTQLQIGKELFVANHVAFDDDDESYHDTKNDQDQDDENKNEDLDSNLNILCNEYLKKYNNIDDIIINQTALNKINDNLMIKIIDHWTVLCLNINESESKSKIIDSYKTMELINCYFDLKQYTKKDIDDKLIKYENVKSLIQLLLMIHEWFDDIIKSSNKETNDNKENDKDLNNSFIINIEHEWFCPYQRPLFDNLDEEIRFNKFDKNVIDFYENICNYCQLLTQSKWNRNLRLCSTELIAIKLYIECKDIREKMDQVFKANSLIIEKRKYFHLSLQIKKSLMYIGQNMINNLNSNSIGFKLGMISPLNNNFSSCLILLNGKTNIIKPNASDEPIDIDKKITKLIDYLITKANRLSNKSDYYEKVGIKEELAKEINNYKYIMNIVNHSSLFTRSSYKKDINWFRKWCSTHKTKYLNVIFEYSLNNMDNDNDSDDDDNNNNNNDDNNYQYKQTDQYQLEICYKVLSLMRGISLDSVNDNDDGKIIEKMRKYTIDPTALYQNYFKQTYFVKSNDKYTSQSMSNFKGLNLKYSVYDRLLNEFKLYYLPFAKFIKVRYSGDPFMQKIKRRSNKQYSKNEENNIYKNEVIRLKNLFEYRRSAIIYFDENGVHLLYDMLAKLEKRFQCNSISIDFKLQYRFIPKYDNEYTKDHKDEIEQTRYEWQCIEFQKQINSLNILNINNNSNIKTLDFMKNGFILHKHLLHNEFQYKLYCKIKQIGKEYIEIDNGEFNVDMRCVVNGNIDQYMTEGEYVITQYPNDNKNDDDDDDSKYGDDGNDKGDVFKFQSLLICGNAKVTVSPFGNQEQNGYLMGYIRIHCYQNLKIDEGSTLHVNGKGYYGAKDVNDIFSTNPGQGGKKVIQLKKNKKSGYVDSISYYAGGGYGTRGEHCIQKKKKGEEIVCIGGNSYGNKKLEILCFGSSGGYGGKQNGADRGGGIIELRVDNEFLNEGEISSTGRRGQIGGRKSSGGSGGSIKIIAWKFCNKGIIKAIGGASGDNHGRGGNGRIAIFSDNIVGGERQNGIQPKGNVYQAAIEMDKGSIIYDRKPSNRSKEERIRHILQLCGNVVAIKADNHKNKSNNNKKKGNKKNEKKGKEEQKEKEKKSRFRKLFSLK